MSLTLNLSKVNLVGLIGGALSLISLGLPWWGVNGLGGVSVQWGLFTTVSPVDSELGTTTLTRAFSTIDPLMIALVVLTALIGFVGSFQKRDNILFGGFANSLFTCFMYVVIAAAAVTAFCNANSSCGLSGPFGSTPVYSWGFQIGYYVFAASAVAFIGAIVFHRTSTQRLPRTQSQAAKTLGSKFCSSCGNSLSSNSKFCSECGSSTQDR